MDASYKFSAFAGMLPRRVRDGDPHGRRLRHGGSVALGGSAALVQYSPTRREYFVRSHRPAGARFACAFAELSSGDDEALKVSSGYEAGFLGMEGRGAYAGVSVGADGGSLYAQWSENGGWSYGFGQSFEAWKYDSEREKLTLFGLLSLDQNLLAADLYDKTNITTNQVGSIMEEDGDGVLSVVVHGNQDGTIQWEGESWNAEDFYDQVLSKKITSATKEIDLYVCLGGYGGKNSFAQKMAVASKLKVRAATGYVRPVVFSILGQVLLTYNRNRLVGDSGKKGNIVVESPKWDYFYVGKYK